MSQMVDLPYLDAWSGMPISYGDDLARCNFTIADRKVAMRDARAAQRPPSLGAEGYTLLRHTSGISSVPSVEEIETAYLPEIEALLKDVTGAAKVYSFASGLRFNERSEHTGSRPNSRPARRVHSDFSDDATREVVAREFGKDGQLPDSGHWKAFNIWRVLTPPPQDTALGFCDMRSMDPRDIVTTKGVVPLPGGAEAYYEFCLYRYNPDHRWAYFPEMTRDEVALFLGYDSRDPDLRVPHCAFDDPSCPADVPPRISVEVRALAFFED